MRCPDCGKTIGRFMASNDDGKSDLQTLRCPQSGRKLLLPEAPAPKQASGRKAWKKNKSQRSGEEEASKTKKKKSVATSESVFAYE